MPTIPGVSVGHNEHGAWGLTVFRTDGEDLYVYETHSDDPDLYRYRGQWGEASARIPGRPWTRWYAGAWTRPWPC